MKITEQLGAYTDGDVDTNRSNVPTLNQLAAERFSRRQTISTALKASVAAFIGTPLLAACDDDGIFGGGGAVTVDAGADATTSAGKSVTLTGTVGNATTATQWTQTGGPAVVLTQTGNSATFIAPAVATATALTFAFGVNGNTASDTTVVTVNPAALGFTSIAKNRNDVVTVPAGYTVTVMTRLGDPIAAGVAAYANDGSDTNFAQRIGDHGDAFHFFGLNTAGTRDDTSNIRGMVAQNHENINQQYLHVNGPTNNASGPRPAAEALKEIECHGVSITEYRDNGNRAWTWVQNSALNRRITPNTPVVFNGPVRGSDFLKTVADSTGTVGKGTINNCATGPMEWGTYLTCEENWAGYFRRNSDANFNARELTSLRRNGVTAAGNFSWSTATPADPMFLRWDARATGASALADYRNEPNKFGWVLEIDPYDPSTAPRKRTALGRFAHEGAWPARMIAGRKVAIYMGDDSRREYLYKFVSSAAWSAADAQAVDRLAIGDKYLDAGTLYVARFNADGTGAWLPLVFGQVPTRAADANGPAYTFTDQVDILVNTRLAGDAVGATPMDRPEWTAVNPVTGEMYLTLTNNLGGRTLANTDAANPRAYNDTTVNAAGATVNNFGNPNGHIIRLRESGDDHTSTTFAWDIFLFGADSAEADATNVNLSGLDASNDFSMPDGLWFSRATNPAGQVRPLLWIETDDATFRDKTNNQMLAALPGSVGDGTVRTITNKDTGGSTAVQTTRAGAVASTTTLRRFLVAPIGSEVTGVDTTPDGRTLFVGIQHPGEDNQNPATPDSHWPDSQATGTAGATVRPRSAIVAITRTDGGVVGL